MPVERGSDLVSFRNRHHWLGGVDNRETRGDKAGNPRPSWHQPPCGFAADGGAIGVRQELLGIAVKTGRGVTLAGRQESDEAVEVMKKKQHLKVYTPSL